MGMSTMPEEVKTTRTEEGGANFAVERRMGTRSLVRRKWPRQLIPIIASWPWTVTAPAGARAHPALFQSTSRLDSWARKEETAGRMVVRSLRSRTRDLTVPGWVVVEVVLTSSIAVVIREAEREAM